MNSRRGLRIACLAVIALLYIFSVPWYRETDAPLSLWFGLPDWVAVAFLCYVGVAFFNAVAWMLCEISDELDDDASGLDIAHSEDAPR